MSKISHYNKMVKKINFWSVLGPLVCLGGPAILYLSLIKTRFVIENTFLFLLLAFVVFMIIGPSIYCLWHIKANLRIEFPVEYLPQIGTREDALKELKTFLSIHELKQYIEEKSNRMYRYEDIIIDEQPAPEGFYMILTKAVGRKKCKPAHCIGYLRIKEE